MRVDGISTGQVNLSGIADILSKLNIGDVIRAQILEITSGEVLLKLFDGTTFTAATLSQVDVKKGDFVDFAVKAKNDNKLFLETVKDKKPGSGPEDIRNQLAGLDVKPDDLNVEIAKEIKNQGFALEKGLIEKAADSLVKFKTLTTDKAVFLALNKIPPEENQISTLSRVVEGKAKINAELSHILNAIKEIDEPEVLKAVQSRLTVPEEVPANTAPVRKEAPAPMTPAVKALVEEGLDNLSSAGFKLPAGREGLSEKLSQILGAYRPGPGENTENLETALRNVLMREIPGAKQADIKSFMEVLINKIKPELPLTASHQMTKDTAEAHKLKDKIITSLERTFIDISSDNLESHISARKIYGQLLDKLDALREGVQHLSNAAVRNDILGKVDSLESNIRFFNEINTYSSYYQIPLHLQNSNTTGELYILKRDSRKKKINPENVTMLISLDTENMGQVDSLVSLNKKSVSVSMRVESQELFGFLKESYKELYNRLSEKGYKLVDFKYRLMEERTNILNANGVAAKELAKGRGSVDYRI